HARRLAAHAGRGGRVLRPRRRRRAGPEPADRAAAAERRGKGGAGRLPEDAWRPERASSGPGQARHRGGSSEFLDVMRECHLTNRDSHRGIRLRHGSCCRVSTKKREKLTRTGRPGEPWLDEARAAGCRGATRPFKIEIFEDSS